MQSKVKLKNTEFQGGGLERRLIKVAQGLGHIWGLGLGCGA